MIFFQNFSTILCTHSKVSSHFVQETEENSFFCTVYIVVKSLVASSVAEVQKLLGYNTCCLLE